MRSRGLRFGAAELNLKGGKSLGKHCRLLGFFLTFTHTLLLPVFYFSDVLFLSLSIFLSLSFTFTLFSHSFSLAFFSVLRSLYLLIPLAFVISQSLSLLVFFFVLASYYFFINHFSLSFSLSRSLIYSPQELTLFPFLPSRLFLSHFVALPISLLRAT